MLNNNWLALIDAIICSAIAARLLLFNTRSLRHKRHISLIAYFLIIFYGNFPILYLYGSHYIDDWPSLVTNALLCVLVYRARGNVARLLSFNEQEKAR